MVMMVDVLVNELRNVSFKNTPAILFNMKKQSDKLSKNSLCPVKVIPELIFEVYGGRCLQVGT